MQARYSWITKYFDDIHKELTANAIVEWKTFEQWNETLDEIRGETYDYHGQS